MLERIAATEGVVFYRSSILHGIGVPHGFSTRLGGVSSGPFASLNLGNPSGCSTQDDRSNIAENYRRLHAAIGAAGRDRWFVHQVHGTTVAHRDAGQPFDCAAKADAVVCGDRSAVAAVRVADCVPVLLSTKDGTTVAAVHAGWRGVAGGIVTRAVEALRASAIRQTGSRSPEIVAAIGPSISFDAFEVGPEVAAVFADRFGMQADSLVRSNGGDRSLVDLRAAIRIQLRGMGVRLSDVDTSDRCTVRDADEFFSHRRENGVTGRMAALIGPV